MTTAIAGICISIAAVEGNLLAPWMMSRAGEMNAVAVFSRPAVLGMDLGGGWGLLLAVPITAVVKAVCEQIPDFNAFAELLKG